mgnify:CR=1 FL=1
MWIKKVVKYDVKNIEHREMKMHIFYKPYGNHKPKKIYIDTQEKRLES